MMDVKKWMTAAVAACTLTTAAAQGGVEDYRRAFDAPHRFSWEKVTGTASEITWTAAGDRLYYRTRTPDGECYRVVDPATQHSDTYATIGQVRAALGIPEPDTQPPHRPRGAQKHWMVTDPETEGEPVRSPDGRSEAYAKNYNIYVRDTESGAERAVTCDGGMGFYYSVYMQWSADSRRLAASKLRRAEKHYVHFVESSPADQLQPRLHTMEYCKPGDDLDYREPRIVDTQTGELFAPANTLFAQQYSLGHPYWLGDESDRIYFEYNERGHKVYRLLEYSAATGAVRTVVEERSDTFVNYSRLWRKYLDGGRKLLWTSERDNYNHIYLYDVASGAVERQITRGAWYVRSIVAVDETQGVIWFTASGMNRKEDPYLVHYYRVNLDGSGLVCLTPAEGEHTVVFSPDRSLVVDTYSKADTPPVTELRDGTTGRLVMPLERADISALEAEGWRAPEVFAAPGRDGKTLMWGIIQRPSNFDPAKRYPVIEYIYAGPGSAYVPKSFLPFNHNTTALAELGFIVVQLDAMGTSFRSKAFEEVCYKNLKDAGLPDRMAWIRAAAKRYPSMDIDRVGIYGASAGGQESMAAVLQYPDFYKAAYSACGCHDNRMDKIWWNEQWMGYPVDASYAASSNVEMAHLLRRPLMLVVGEMDDNVDPASTMQVVHALIRAGRDFELVVLPGEGHTMGGTFGEHKRYDFFVRTLMHKAAPDWEALREND